MRVSRNQHHIPGLARTDNIHHGSFKRTGKSSPLRLSATSLSRRGKLRQIVQVLGLTLARELGEDGPWNLYDPKSSKWRRLPKRMSHWIIRFPFMFTLISTTVLSPILILPDMLIKHLSLGQAAGNHWLTASVFFVVVWGATAFTRWEINMGIIRSISAKFDEQKDEADEEARTFFLNLIVQRYKFEDLLLLLSCHYEHQESISSDLQNQPRELKVGYFAAITRIENFIGEHFHYPLEENPRAPHIMFFEPIDDIAERAAEIMTASMLRTRPQWN